MLELNVTESFAGWERNKTVAKLFPTGSDQPSGRDHTDLNQRGLAESVSVNAAALIAGNRRGTPSDDETDFNSRGEAFRMGV